MVHFKSVCVLVVMVLVLALALSAQVIPATGGATRGGPAGTGTTAPGGVPSSVLSDGQVILIWEELGAGTAGLAQAEDMGVQGVVRNVAHPTLTAYVPENMKANATAVVVCPGGAFRALSWSDEGVQVAKWLNQQGMAAFVLRYHLLDSRAGARAGGGGMAMPQLPRNLEIKNANANPEPDNKELAKVVELATADGLQAIKIIRQNAEKWRLNPRRIGIMGFSAGGGVAVGSALGNEAASRPDFVATLYGPALVDVNVPKDAPPLFIAVAADHVPVSAGCVALYSVWKAAGKAAELHVYANGRAGFGMRKQGLPSDTWTERFSDWMKVQGF